MIRHAIQLIALTAGAVALASCSRTATIAPTGSASNGIYVDEPKVYDDASLETLLRSAQARVAALSGFDQTSLTKQLGQVQGATASQTQVSAQVGGLPKQGATAQAVTPNAPGAPNLPSFTLPSSFSPSASDLLNEQTQLNFQMTNLQLLLEGSLNDQFVEGTTMQKRRVTLGFPITISVGPGSQYQQAVAEVEVSVCNPPKSDQSSDPTLVNIIPREKTYNVASIVNKSASIGGGAIAGVVNFGGGLFFGHQTYYLVQDQDTLALARPPREGVCTNQTRIVAENQSEPVKPVTFVWQFRPVLGQKVVRDGMRQTFAQIAMPPGFGPVACSAYVEVRSSWHRYDVKSGRVGPLIEGTERIAKNRVASYDISPAPRGLITQDNGDGTVTVLATGGFKSGTRVRIGSQIIDTTTPAQFEQNPTYIKFIAGAAQLAMMGAKMVNRDGTEADIVAPKEGEKASTGCEDTGIKQLPPQSGTTPATTTPATTTPAETAVTPAPLTDSTSILTLPVTKADLPGPAEVAVVVIGTQVFGLRNSPFLSRTDTSVDLVVPNDLLRTNNHARWVKLFHSGPPHLYSLATTAGFAPPAIALLASGLPKPPSGGGSGATPSTRSLFAITGAKLQDLTISLPDGSHPDGGDVSLNTETIRTFWLSDDLAKQLKSVVVQKPGGAAIVLALPALPGAAGGGTPATPPKPSIDAQPAAGIAATAKTLALTGVGMSQVVAILSGGTPLAFNAPTDKTLTLTLPALSAPGITVVFIYMDKSLQPYFIPVAAGGQ